MTTPVHNTVVLTEPSDVLAAVPHLVGFRPTDSLVLIAVHDPNQIPRFGLVLRSDLPSREGRYQLAEYLLEGPITRQGVGAVLVVIVSSAGSEREAQIVDPQTPCTELPHRDLVAVIREVLGGAGVSVLHAAWTPEIRAGGLWRCYDEPDCGGTISDPSSSPLAAALAAAGAVTFDSRQELEQLVAPEAPEIIARRAARLDAMYDDAEQERTGENSVQRDIEIVFAAIRKTAEGSAVTEDELLRILIALSDQRVRDFTLTTALGDCAGAAEQLWTNLVRKAPSPELAEVASLLAFSAYLRGDGALAGLALERIEATRPEHRLGILLRQALDAGISPEDLADIATDAAEDAQTMIEEDDSW